MPPSDAPGTRAYEETCAIEQVLDGDAEAYALLVHRYGGALFRYLVRMVKGHDAAEDLTQEAFLRAYLSLASYDARYRFSTWLFRIATNLALNWIKAEKRLIRIEALRSSPDDPTPELVNGSEADRPERWAERVELAQLVQECLEELPPAYRTVVALRHIADLSYQEIAESTDLPLNTVRSRLHRGRERLGECLEKYMPEEESR